MNNLTSVPPPGTAVVQAGTGRHGVVTGDAGHDGNGRIALVQWNDRDVEDVSYVHFLALDEWGTPRGEPADISEDD